MAILSDHFCKNPSFNGPLQTTQLNMDQFDTDAQQLTGINFELNHLKEPKHDGLHDTMLSLKVMAESTKSWTTFKNPNMSPDSCYTLLNIP